MSKIELYQGDEFNLEFQLRDDSGNPTNLSSATVKFYIEDKDGNSLFGTPLLCTVLDESNGRFFVRITSTQTAQVGKYYYEIVVEYEYGDIITVDKGELIVYESAKV